MAFDVYSEKSVEFDNLARGSKSLGTAGGSDVYYGFLDLGVSHLGCYRALPYQIVEAAFLRGAFDGVPVYICGAYSLMGLLGALAAGVVMALLEVFFAVGCGDFLRDGRQCHL